MAQRLILFGNSGVSGFSGLPFKVVGIKQTSICAFTVRHNSSDSQVPSAEHRADFVPRIITKSAFPDPVTQRLKRGTGGRSSWNGMVVTVFGGNGLVGRKLVSKLGKMGAQVRLH